MVDANPPHLVSPVDGLVVRAVLDEDATLTAGLASTRDRRRSVILVATDPGHPSQREEFIAWCRALESIAGTAHVARIAGFGHTDDGRAYLATYVGSSLADRLRLDGQLDVDDVRGLGAVLADALATAHSYGIAHAAVSPATILITPDGACLAGFGATAPTLSGPLGVWAFTAPEHRVTAAAGSEISSPAADVFALAATMCVAIAGALPWSDPTTWADAARLPSGPDAPDWVKAIRAALDADPDQRPNAEEFAHVLRRVAGPVTVGFHGAKVDLRALIPRTVRRLAASSVDAMSEGDGRASGRATAPGSRVVARARRGARTRQMVVGFAATAVLLIVAVTAFSLLGRASNAVANGPTGGGTLVPQQTLLLMAGAREASESWLHRVAAGDASACQAVRGARIVTTAPGTTPVTCGDLVAHRATLLPPKAITAMRSATVLEVTGLTVGMHGTSTPVRETPATSDNGSGTDDAYAYVSLPYVPALASTLHRLEITMTFRDGHWWVASVVVW